MSTPASSSPLSSSCALTFSRLFCSPLRRLAPVATCFIAPFILLLTPILLSLGFGFIVFGLGRAGLIVTYRGGNEEPEILSNDDGRTALQRTLGPSASTAAAAAMGSRTGTTDKAARGGERRTRTIPQSVPGAGREGRRQRRQQLALRRAPRGLRTDQAGNAARASRVTGHGGHIVKRSRRLSASRSPKPRAR